MSIPTYVLLALKRIDGRGQEAALKYFFLSLVACRVTGETDTTPTGAMGKVTQLIFGALNLAGDFAIAGSYGCAAVYTVGGTHPASGRAFVHYETVGGGLGADILAIHPAYAFEYLVYFLMVVAVGGLGSIRGPFVAAVLLGVSDTAFKYLVPEIGAFVIYIAVIGLLLWRPAGLFGRA